MLAAAILGLGALASSEWPQSGPALSIQSAEARVGRPAPRLASLAARASGGRGRSGCGCCSRPHGLGPRSSKWHIRVLLMPPLSATSKLLAGRVDGVYRDSTRSLVGARGNERIVITCQVVLTAKRRPRSGADPDASLRLRTESQIPLPTSRDSLPRPYRKQA